MKGKTHISVGLATTALIATEAILNPVAILAVVIGSLAPDIDINGSTISKRVNGLIKDLLFIGIGFVLISMFLKKRGISFNMANLNLDFSPKTLLAIVILLAASVWSRITGHRGFAHSILGLITFSIAVYLIFPNLAKWFAIGYMSHMIIDLLNFKGESLLYPLSYKFKLGLCESDGIMDVIICIICTVIFFATLITSIKIF